MLNYIDLYTEDNLPEELQTAASIIGLDAVKKLLKTFGGTTLYFPVRPDKKFIVNYINQHYDFENRLKIQRFLDIKKDTFYKALKTKVSARKAG